MKAKIVRDDAQASQISPEMREQRKNDLHFVEVPRNGRIQKVEFWKRGAVIENPQAYMLVRMGVAVPADDECRERCDMNQDEMREAQKGYERLTSGIDISNLEEVALFNRGCILGKLPDGSYKPGPKWDEYQAELASRQAVADTEEDNYE